MTPYYEQGGVTLYHGDVLGVLRELPDESVNCCVTSPPYWSLRDYKLRPSVWGGREDCAPALVPFNQARTCFGVSLKITSAARKKIPGTAIVSARGTGLMRPTTDSWWTQKRFTTPMVPK